MRVYAVEGRRRLLAATMPSQQILKTGAVLEKYAVSLCACAL